MLDASEFLLEWTDIDDMPAAIFEIRGNRKGGKGHSMNLEFFSDGTATLREPQERGAMKWMGSLEDPWLVYQC